MPHGAHQCRLRGALLRAAALLLTGPALGRCTPADELHGMPHESDIFAVSACLSQLEAPT